MEPREARDADVARLRAERDRLWAELETANGNLVGGSATEVAKVDGWPRWRNKLRLLMRFPSSSRAAFALGVWSVASILLFVVIMIVTSQPHYRADGYEDLKQVTWWISFGIQVSFLVEMLLNWLVMRNRAEFLSFVSLLDIATIVPFWIGIFVMVGYHASPIGIALTGLTLLRVLRLLRVAKIFRTRRSGRIVLLAQAVKESSFGILALVVIFPLIALFFGISVYYAESASCYADPKTGLWIYAYPPNTGIESKFQSIDIALWFMFVTLTTTGCVLFNSASCS